MFKRTAVPPVGPSEHHARQPLNMALAFSSGISVRRFAARAAEMVYGVKVAWYEAYWDIL
jgi:hypothetical protein